MDWTTKEVGIDEEELIIAVGGANAVIQIINVSNSKYEKTLGGHMDDIYDISFNPLKHNLLLSASKDCSIRLWNISTYCQLAIFAGVDGHFGGVNCIDWHPSGNLFVSGGMDYCVKIWKLTPEVNARIEESMKWTSETKKNPLYVCVATFSTNKVLI